MLAHYREGLRMQATAIKEVGEMRAQQEIARAGADDNGKMWEVFAPATQVAVLQAQQRLMGGPPLRALPGPKGAIVRNERRVHQPAGRPTRSVGAPGYAEAAAAELPEPLVGLSHVVLKRLAASTLLRLSRALSEGAGWVP